jgi:hypothetical protein
MTYVRDRGNRTLEVDGEEAVVGYTEPVDWLRDFLSGSADGVVGPAVVSE